MSSAVQLAYDQLLRHARRIALLGSIESVLNWDEQTMLVDAGSEYRAEQLSYLAGRLHQEWVDPRFGELLATLDELTRVTGANQDCVATVRQLKRKRDKRVKLPQSLVEELTRTTVLARQAWIDARRSDDFSRFAPVLSQIFALKRQEANCLGFVETPYDPLLDDYEPGLPTREASRLLAELQAALVPLVRSVVESGRRGPREILGRSYPIAMQERFARETASQLGFDFSRGRLDTTAHPFCTSLGPHDIRILTRYDERDFSNAFFGVMHEAGHGLYEQGLPPEHFGMPLGEAVSLGVHESQSRLWENFVCRSMGFWQWAYPAARAAFPEALSDVSLDQFYFAVNDVRPSLIRTEADEATYNLHIIVRFELERDLMEDRLRCADLPEAWNERYQRVVGIQPPGDGDGVLQDIHWSAGLVGYFPTYALGNLYAAQLFAQAEADLGLLAGQFARGEFAPLLDWLRRRVHQYGSRWPAAELVQRAVGAPLSPAPLINHLRAKLEPLYQLD